MSDTERNVFFLLKACRAQGKTSLAMPIRLFLWVVQNWIFCSSKEYFSDAIYLFCIKTVSLKLVYEKKEKSLMGVMHDSFLFLNHLWFTPQESEIRMYDKFLLCT